MSLASASARARLTSTSTISRPTPLITSAYAEVEPTAPHPTTPTFMTIVPRQSQVGYQPLSSKIFATASENDVFAAFGRRAPLILRRCSGHVDVALHACGSRRCPMPVVDYARYCQMLDRARQGRFAYPAINVTSLTTANAVLKGLADSKSDGIIQVSTGGGAFASGAAVKDMALGAISIAEHVHRVAARYPIYVALHTDHCQADKLDAFVMPLVEETERRRAAGQPN